jgi:hypothetical protein
MSANHIVIASQVAFYMWQFKNVKQRAIVEVSNKLKAGMEKSVLSFIQNLFNDRCFASYSGA